jgi:hypothetical protein
MPHAALVCGQTAQMKGLIGAFMKFINPREEDQGEKLNLVKRVLKDYAWI